MKFALADCVMLAEKESDRITQNKERPLLLRGYPPLQYVRKQWFLFKTKRKLVRIQKELIQLMTDADDVGPSLSSSSTGLVSVYGPTDLPHINFSRIHGFNEHLQKMEALLLQDTFATTNNFRVIGIVGMGGSGKTTLAQMVFHSPRVRKRFSHMLWIDLPHQYSNPILSSGLAQDLLGYLFGEKYLIVLDINGFDLNSELEPKRDSYVHFLRECCPREDGATIIFTSRTKESAFEKMDRLDMIDELCWYQLEPMLDKDSCWSIILDTIGEEISRHPILPKIKDYMVERCDGLPFAAKTLADIISTK